MYNTPNQIHVDPTPSKPGCRQCRDPILQDKTLHLQKTRNPARILIYDLLFVNLFDRALLRPHWFCFLLQGFALVCFAFQWSPLLYFVLFALICCLHWFVLLCFVLLCFLLLSFASCGFVLHCFVSHDFDLQCFTALCNCTFCILCCLSFVHVCFALLCVVLLCFPLFRILVTTTEIAKKNRKHICLDN